MKMETCPYGRALQRELKLGHYISTIASASARKK